MSELTKILKLFKYDTKKDRKRTFNISQCLNDNWDKIEKDMGLFAYNSDAIYSKDKVVVAIVNNKVKMYKSLINGNLNNELTNATAWEEVINLSRIEEEISRCLTRDNKKEIVAWGVPDWINRQIGVKTLDVWKTVNVDSWVSIATLTYNLNRTLMLLLRDENGNDIEGAVDNRAIMRAQQYYQNTINQVFCYVPAKYSYKGIIDSDQTFYSSYEYPLKGVN